MKGNLVGEVGLQGEGHLDAQGVHRLVRGDTE